MRHKRSLNSREQKYLCAITDVSKKNVAHILYGFLRGHHGKSHPWGPARGMPRQSQNAHAFKLALSSFSSPEAVLFLVSIKNQDFLEGPIFWPCAEKSFRILGQSELSDLTLSMRRVTGSPWIADLRCWTFPEAWPRDRDSWCWPKYGARPLGMRIHVQSLKLWLRFFGVL